MKEILKAISANDLEKWLAYSTAAARPTASSLLAEKVRYRFSEATATDSLLYARPARFPEVSYRWRASPRGPVFQLAVCSSWLKPEGYVTVPEPGAIYCDAYITKEPGQVEYAHLLLTPNTSVHIYTAEAPIDKWLESLTLNQSSAAA